MNELSPGTLALWAGWSEIALVAGPLVGLWLLLVMANRRAKRKQ